MKYVVANWKMKMSLTDVYDWLANFKDLYTISDTVGTIVAPSYPHLLPLHKLFSDFKSASVASQDVSANAKGSHTGEVGAFQVSDLCSYAIIGHSERAEDLALVTEKRDIALTHNLTPIICFTSPDQAEVLYKEGVIMAWEDPENISKGGKYKEKSIEEVISFVKNIRESLPTRAILLYGGSVNRDNIGNLTGVEGLDGVLVGQASLDPFHFLDLIKAYEVSGS